MPGGYRHPAFDGRCRIFATGKSGLSNGAIARWPGRAPSTISREIRRGGGGRGYRRRQAQGKATERRSDASSVPGKLTGERRSSVVAKPGRAGARSGSPVASGRKIRGWRAVSGYTTASGPTAGGGSPLTHLRRRGRKPNRQGGRHAGRGHIPGRRDIPERPETVWDKARTGDREADTVIGGGHGGAAVPPVDGCPEFTPVRRVDGKRAEAVGKAMTDLPRDPAPGSTRSRWTAAGSSRSARRWRRRPGPASSSRRPTTRGSGA